MLHLPRIAGATRYITSPRAPSYRPLPA